MHECTQVEQSVHVQGGAVQGAVQEIAGARRRQEAHTRLVLLLRSC
jgi:hypothetical protein